MVFDQALDVVLERVDPGRGHDPCLPHGSAEEMLHPARLGHALPRSRDERAEWAAEPL
jgi:hypothetical protein